LDAPVILKWLRHAEPVAVGLAAFVGGRGTAGARLHDWAYSEWADLDYAEYNTDMSGTWARGLLIMQEIRRIATRMTHRACLHQRMVHVATRASGRGTMRAPDGNNATVMLERCTRWSVDRSVRRMTGDAVASPAMLHFGA
jgi:SRSO17 transposase